MMVVVIALCRMDMVADLIYMMVVVLPWRSDKKADLNYKW